MATEEKPRKLTYVRGFKEKLTQDQIDAIVANRKVVHVKKQLTTMLEHPEKPVKPPLLFKKTSEPPRESAVATMTKFFHSMIRVRKASSRESQ